MCLLRMCLCVWRPQVLLSAAQAKGLEIHGTFARRAGKIFLELTFTNRAMQPVSDFAFQFNTNSFGVTPAAALQVRSPLPPNQTADTALQLVTTGTPTYAALLHSV
jgi:AP-1 complex subunit beta-1